MAQVVEPSPSKLKALSSIPSTFKKIKIKTKTNTKRWFKSKSVDIVQSA
jgi:hypothetical protein